MKFKVNKLNVTLLSILSISLFVVFFNYRNSQIEKQQSIELIRKVTNIQVNEDENFVAIDFIETYEQNEYFIFMAIKRDSLTFSNLKNRFNVYLFGTDIDSIPLMYKDYLRYYQLFNFTFTDESCDVYSYKWWRPSDYAEIFANNFRGIDTETGILIEDKYSFGKVVMQYSDSTIYFLLQYNGR